ncbi:MAG: hypothetical protein JNL11_03495 [Bdellovibrionaceae bacterium]|nr:hypothetical protein [Pseudobdellovibrionaceae bacterium]
MRFEISTLLFISILLSGDLGYSLGNCTNHSHPQKSIEDVKKIADRLTDALNDSKTYFEAACNISETDSDELKSQKLNSLKGKPITTGLRTTIPFVDSAGNLSQDFFKKVLAKIQKRRKFNKVLALKIANCSIEGNTNLDDCKSVRSWTENQLPQIIRLARYNLALAHHSPNASLLGTKEELNLNLELDSKKSSKEVPWEALNLEEIKIAEAGFKSIQSEVGSNVSSRSKGLNKSERENLYLADLLRVRHTHYMIYLSFMGINPIMQYLKSPNPTNSEIHIAAKTVLENLEKENQLLSKIENAVEKPYSVGRSGTKSFDSQVLDLLSYRTEVEEVLLEDPKYCGLGVSLHQVKSNRQTTVALAGLPILAASFLVPPLYGLAIGALSAGYFVYDSQGRLDDNLARENARIQREGMVDFLTNITTEGKKSDQIRDDLQKDVTRVYRKNLQSLRESESERDASVVLAPVVLVSPVAAKYIASFSKNMFMALR